MTASSSVIGASSRIRFSRVSSYLVALEHVRRRNRRDPRQWQRTREKRTRKLLRSTVCSSHSSYDRAPVSSNVEPYASSRFVDRRRIGEHRFLAHVTTVRVRINRENETHRCSFALSFSPQRLALIVAPIIHIRVLSRPAVSKISKVALERVPSITRYPVRTGWSLSREYRGHDSRNSTKIYHHCPENCDNFLDSIESF